MNNYCGIDNKCGVRYDQIAQEECSPREHQCFDKFVKCPYLAESGECKSANAREEAGNRLINERS
jgi:hypothetical protein